MRAVSLQNPSLLFISFIAVKPDYTVGAVYKHWRGDKETTTQTDVANKFSEMAHGITLQASYYDWSSKDFKTITDRMGLSFQPAEKSHEIGEKTLNALFKTKMLYVFDLPENEPISQEFLSLLLGTEKRHSKDDSVDSVRYGVTRIPWDWSKTAVNFNFEPRDIRPMSPDEEAYVTRNKDRVSMFKGIENQENDRIEDEIARWADFYD